MKAFKDIRRHFRTAFLICGMLAAVMFSSEAANSVRSSMIYTASTVIPTLFPFMVLSKLILSSNVKIREDGRASKFCARVFGLSADAATSVLLSFIGCFPVGAAAVCDSCKKGGLARTNAERALALSHNTGPSFPIAFVGGVLWQSKCFGVALYVFQILSWVAACAVFRVRKAEAFTSAVDADDECRNKPGGSFSSVICDSAISCVNITAFTAFMRLCVDAFLLLLPNNAFYAAVVSSFLEFSDGCVRASKLGGIVGCALCGFAVGWGGLCAALQASSYAHECGISPRALVKVKLFEGLLCGALSAFYCIFFPLESASRPVYEPFISNDSRAFICLCGIALAYLLTKIFTSPPKGDKIS